VHGHGGGLQLISTPNVGTTFRIFFPTSEKAVEVAPQEDQRDPFGHGLVLVVDDDEYVIQAAYVALKSFGYSVIVAEDGYKAVEIFRSRGAEIDLVVLDLTMPGMRGDETLHALRDLRPEVKVLLSTAYDEEETARQVATTDVVDFLQKPYDPNRLAIKVKQLLEGGEAPLPAVESDRSLSAVRATYRQRLPGRLQALAAALQAAQTDGGSDETVQQAFHLAHRLKGTVGSYGFDVIAETLESIEETLQKMQLGQIAATAAEWSKLQDTLNRGQASLE
jgi:CheY-like chemotaxis protein